MANTIEIYCADCEQKLTMGDEVCPKCNSKKNTKVITNVLEIGLQLGIKLKSPGFKKPIQEYKAGDDWCHNSRKWVRKERNIDREKNQYREIIKDKITGELIHKKEESLSNHRGYGSAKYKKSKSDDNR